MSAEEIIYLIEAKIEYYKLFEDGGKVVTALEMLIEDIKRGEEK